MNTKRRGVDGSEMLAEYDFSNAVRGKYCESYRQGTNVVLLDADVAEVFPSATAVNDALRLLVALADAKATRRSAGARRQRKKPRAARRTAAKTPAKTRSGVVRS
jgi:hypothetical protein